MKNVHNLDFGEVSAEREFAIDEEEFFRRYLDVWNVEKKFHRKGFFLVLGPKGCGKTAVGYYCQKLLEKKYGEELVINSSLNMDDLAPNISQLSSLTSKLVSEDAQGVTISAWKLFIAIEFAKMVQRDQGSALNSEPGFVTLMKDLTAAGLASGEFPTVLRAVRESKLTLTAKILGGFENKKSSSESISIGVLGATLLDLIMSYSTSSNYLLTIDGLDRIIGDKPAYWLSVASLITAASAIHYKLTAKAKHMNLLVMCRTDVFRKVRLADADKVVGDQSIYVDWANQQTKTIDNFLWDYLAKKANISVEELLELFPDKVDVGMKSQYGSRSIDGIYFLFTSTRATPREMTMLMRQVQDATPSGGILTGPRLRNAVDNFASRDLITILNAESSGILPDSVQSRLGEIISSLPSARQIDLVDLEKSISSANLDQNTRSAIVEFLFMAGWIGNMDPNTNYIQFYYRRDTYSLKPSGPWALHRGLQYAFNVPY
ncbi:P-loop ATPase, Sll1717 family [Glutamicibacter sp. AOP33-2CA-4]|uniref:P-loop ATPase, Sll1717 family n=1 Tax=Glutamicibacter sp. AOP33-2CA-4 TaxID=3457690 RepID=UPI0040332D8C